MRIRLFSSTALFALAAILPAHAQTMTMETAIVTAAGNPGDPPIVAEARERLSRTPGAVSVVAAESYENRLATGFPDLLRDVPGVLSNKRYGEESRLSIRGSGLDQSYHQRGVLLAQDGVPFGLTLLHTVAGAREHVTAEERAAFASLLLDAGARLDARDRILKSTPLGWACRWGRAELVELFLQRGAPAVESDAEPWAQPRAWAEKMGHGAILELLNQHGV